MWVTCLDGQYPKNIPTGLIVVAPICNPSSTGGIGRGIMIWGWPQAKSLRHYLKNNESKKRLGGIVQVVEHLASKCKALRSSSSTAKRKKKCKKAGYNTLQACKKELRIKRNENSGRPNRSWEVYLV
jgi:hypothetical protein